MLEIVKKGFLAKSIHTGLSCAKTIPKNLKGKSNSSQEWILRQLNDPYVKKAQEMNYRARSAFKLIEMDDKIKILRPGITVVECGAAPGAWTQVVVQRINSDGKVTNKRMGKAVGIDLLSISPLPGAYFLPQTDFTHPESQNKIKSLLAHLKNQENPGSGSDSSSSNFEPLVDVVLSDMAPNATGLNDTNHYRIIALARSALQFAIENGKVGSHFLTKLWDGSETKIFEKQLSDLYESVRIIKPPCSRSESSELFMFAKSKRC